MADLFFITLLLLIGFFWSDSLKAREIAFRAAKTHCQQMNVQLLDEYVALNALWPRKDKDGKTRAWRSYQFEFSSTGNERYNGKIIMLGKKILSVQLEPHIIEE